MMNSLLWQRNWRWFLGSLLIAGCINLLGTRVIDWSLPRWYAYAGMSTLIATLAPAMFVRLGVRHSSILMLQRYRRDFGITTGLLIVQHWLTAIGAYSSLANVLSFMTQPAVLPGTVGLLVLLSMLATSTAAVQRVLGGRWQALHAFIWMVVPLVLVHSLRVSYLFRGGYGWIGTVGFGFLIILGVLNLIRLLVRGERSWLQWRRAAYLVLGGIEALLLWLYT